MGSPVEAYWETRKLFLRAYEIEDVQEKLEQIHEQQARLATCFDRLIELGENSNPEIWFAIGDAFNQGYGTERNREEALRWYQRAAEAEHTRSMVRIGSILRHPDTPESHAAAVAWFRKAADLGDSYGMVCLGFAYRDGHGVPSDEAVAVKWFSKAVEAGDGHSMIYVGRIYAGEVASHAKAVKWFRRAAEAGFSDSHIALAMLYDNQSSAVYDPSAAVKWYHSVVEASKGSVGRAMLALAEHCMEGIGTPRDLKKAEEWLNRILQKEPEESSFRRQATGLLQQMHGNLLPERVFIQLAKRWHQGFTAVERDKAAPRMLDELALAALLLAQEHGASFTSVAWEQAEDNISLANKRAMPWIDRLPWSLALAGGELDPEMSSAVEELNDNLDHHNSGLRIWVMELGWMCRPWLGWEYSLPRLLKNVADTISGVDLAWGLAGALVSSTEDFYDFAEEWQPESFAEQYAQRVTRFEESGLTVAQASFWKTEAICRRIITDTAVANLPSVGGNLSNE